MQGHVDPVRRLLVTRHGQAVAEAHLHRRRPQRAREPLVGAPPVVLRHLEDDDVEAAHDPGDLEVAKPLRRVVARPTGPEGRALEDVLLVAFVPHEKRHRLAAVRQGKLEPLPTVLEGGPGTQGPLAELARIRAGRANRLEPLQPDFATGRRLLVAREPDPVGARVVDGLEDSMVCVGLDPQVAAERAVILALSLLVQDQLLWVQQMELGDMRLMALATGLVAGAGDGCGLLGHGGVGVGVDEMEVAQRPVRAWSLVSGGVPRDLVHIRVRIEHVVSLRHCRVSG